MKELERNARSGLLWFIITSVLLVGAIAAVALGIIYASLVSVIAGAVVFIAWGIMLGGFFTLQPNEAAVLILFGAYKGTVKKGGWHWANPFYTKKRYRFAAGT